MQKRWVVKQVDENIVAELQTSVGILKSYVLGY